MLNTLTWETTSSWPASSFGSMNCSIGIELSRVHPKQCHPKPTIKPKGKQTLLPLCIIRPHYGIYHHPSLYALDRASSSWWFGSISVAAAARTVWAQALATRPCAEEPSAPITLLCASPVEHASNVPWALGRAAGLGAPLPQGLAAPAAWMGAKTSSRNIKINPPTSPGSSGTDPE